MTIQERLKAIRKSLNMNQTEFAQRIGMQQSNLSAIELGRKAVTGRTIKLICSEFSVNEQWLRSGEGEMFSDASASLLDKLAEIYHLTEFEMRILSNYVSMPTKQREAIMDFIQRINSEIYKKPN